MTTIKFFLLLLLCACTKSDNWSVDNICTGSSEFDSSRLFYPAHDRVSGIDLEMLATTEKLRIYLDVHSHAIPAFDDDPQQALVKISTPLKKIVFVAHRMQGGQRLLLPDSAHEFILSSLHSGQLLTIQIPGYSATIAPEGFSKKFNKLNRSSFWPIIRLPI